MNFIAKWRHDRCGVNGECDTCTRECKPRAELCEETEISEHLMWILQNQRGGVTHPKLADRIADYVGATPEERDSIVHKRHRGTYVPGSAGAALQDVRNRRVVAIDKRGRIIKKFTSTEDAAQHYGCSRNSVWERCTRFTRDISEFSLLDGISFRYAAKWSKLSDTERLRDIIEVGLQSDNRRESN